MIRQEIIIVTREDLDKEFETISYNSIKLHMFKKDIVRLVIIQMPNLPVLFTDNSLLKWIRK